TLPSSQTKSHPLRNQILDRCSDFASHVLAIVVVDHHGFDFRVPAEGSNFANVIVEQTQSDRCVPQTVWTNTNALLNRNVRLSFESQIDDDLIKAVHAKRFALVTRIKRAKN